MTSERTACLPADGTKNTQNLGPVPAAPAPENGGAAWTLEPPVGVRCRFIDDREFLKTRLFIGPLSKQGTALWSYGAMMGNSRARHGILTLL